METRKLNLGCFNYKVNGWTNVDRSPCGSGQRGKYTKEIFFSTVRERGGERR